MQCKIILRDCLPMEGYLIMQEVMSSYIGPQSGNRDSHFQHNFHLKFFISFFSSK